MLMVKVFPAYAGVIPKLACIDYPLLRFSRIRGGDPNGIYTPNEGRQFSPHARG